MEIDSESFPWPGQGEGPECDKWLSAKELEDCHELSLDV